MTNFETKRLILRQYQPKDYQLWKEGIENRLPPQNEFDVGKVPFTDKKYFYDFLSYIGALKKVDKLLVFPIFDKMSGKHLGVLEFTILFRGEFNWAMVGVSIHNQFWNLGYGSEVMEKAMEIGKVLGLRRLECAIEPNNFASKKMVQKAGMKFECVREKFALSENGFQDMEIFSIVLNS